MGVLYRNVFVAFLTGVLLAILFTLDLSENLEFHPYNYTAPLPLEGPLSINNKLNNAVRLYEGSIKGPEALAIFNNELYMTTHGGYVFKMLDENVIVPVLKTGKNCDGIWEEKICGRPLGLKFDDSGTLYLADAYYGIIKGNITSGDLVTLIPMDVPIEGKVPMLPNSIDVGKDGTVYWTDSSTTHHLEDGIFILLGNGSGRLLSYDPKTRKSKVLIDKLHFSNGIALSKDESFIIVAETAQARIIKYYLRGSKAGTSEIFVDRLPGLPDNIQVNEKGGFIVCLIKPEDSNSALIQQFLGSYPSIRKLLVNFFSLIELLFNKLDYYYPNYLAKRAVHWIGHFESFKWIYGNRVTIVFLDDKGIIFGSLHATDGKISGISDIIAFKGYYFLGSPYNSYLGRVKVL